VYRRWKWHPPGTWRNSCQKNLAVSAGKATSHCRVRHWL